MPTYISLYNWTEQGIANLEESPDRIDAALELLEELGGTLVGFYMTMGEYDLATVAE
ncbi:MAG: GYD domain-containing protein, partial [Actinobacteria bacterium]|nr:GYD domain-containing protein [Actinomycetota bacterium]NIU65494.1 GYD domain-containing protein [Actinomycetota bacterium]NIV86466.1 GYD domain-containing protein [Actinomycetota bacterium]NIX19841.1 GYD domain-containing protein [Actinomycetota bacterium]